MTQGRSRIDLSNQTARSRAMASKRTGVFMIVGVFEWGPLDTATVCIDYSDFVETFGGLIASYYSPQDVKDYFDGGGRRAVVVRVVHKDASAVPVSAVKATHNFLTAPGGTYASSATLQVDGLYYGALGNVISVKIQDASNEEAGRFDLLVYKSGVLVDGEWYRNLSMLDSDDLYVEDVINTASTRSKYIAVTDLALGGAPGLAVDERPANIAATLLTTGDNGLAALASSDFIGTVGNRDGLFAFNTVSDGDLLAMPDDTTTASQNLAIAYCESEKKGKITFLTDVPAASDSDAVKTHAEALTASECRSAVLWPRVKIDNPDKTIYGQADTYTVPASGMYAGRIAKNAYTEKTQMWTQPSNEIYGLLDRAVGLETDEVLEPTVQDFVTDYKVNPILAGIRETDGNYGVWVNDCLLGKTSGNFISMGEQMGVAYLRKTFESYMERHRTQGNTENRRRIIQAAFEAELLKWTAAEAFATTRVSDAFYVNADPEGVGLNNAVVRDAQRLRVLVGVATARPARFIDIIFTRDNRAIESYIQQQLAANS